MNIVERAVLKGRHACRKSQLTELRTTSLNFVTFRTFPISFGLPLQFLLLLLLVQYSKKHVQILNLYLQFSNQLNLNLLGLQNRPSYFRKCFPSKSSHPSIPLYACPSYLPTYKPGSTQGLKNSITRENESETHVRTHPPSWLLLNFSPLCLPLSCMIWSCIN